VQAKKNQPDYVSWRLKDQVLREELEDELKRLRREVTQLRQERDVLKKSVAVFARDRS
jgi:transposase-like protein